nr:unnamed protein product [Callosobruchus analis]
MKELSTNWEKLAPVAFGYERNTEQSKIVSKAIKAFYVQDKPLEKSYLTNIAQIYSDANVGFAVNRAAKLFAEYNNQSVYYYRFSYQGRYSNFYTPESNKTAPYGIVHFDDLIYLFQNDKLFPAFKETTPIEIEMVTKLTTLMYNFAKTGNPIPTPSENLDNVKWEPFTVKDQRYMEIGNKMSMHERLHEKRFSEWEKLYPLSIYTKNKQSH